MGWVSVGDCVKERENNQQYQGNQQLTSSTWFAWKCTLFSIDDRLNKHDNMERRRDTRPPRWRTSTSSEEEGSLWSWLSVLLLLLLLAGGGSSPATMPLAWCVIVVIIIDLRLIIYESNCSWALIDADVKLLSCLQSISPSIQFVCSLTECQLWPAITIILHRHFWHRILCQRRNEIAILLMSFRSVIFIYRILLGVFSVSRCSVKIIANGTGFSDLPYRITIFFVNNTDMTW